MNRLPYLYILMIIIASVTWTVLAWRSRVRSLGRELKALSPVPAHKLIQVLTEMAPPGGGLEAAETLREKHISEAWNAIGGLSGLHAINKNAQCLLRIFAAGEAEYGEMFATDDLEFIRGQAVQIREELPLAIAEYKLSRRIPVIHLHAFRIARLYCDLVGRLSAIADHYDSVSLEQTLAKL